jgi:hypothetical protein
VATATFTFDAHEQTVWLDAQRDGSARAGELCERHANTLMPPRGWRLDDRRADAAAVAVAMQAPAAAAEAADGTFESMLHPRSPMLARAFESSGA